MDLKMGSDAGQEDWQQFSNADVEKQAKRLCALVSAKSAPKRKAYFATLDVLLGALHEFVRADMYKFGHRTNQEPDVAAIIRRADELGKGRLRRDGTWMAGLHFNSALIRLSAVHHRSMKIVVGSAVAKDLDLYDLRKLASKFHKEHKGKPWAYSNIAIVHREVNIQKHSEAGNWSGRTVPVETARRATSETLDLLEVWAAAKLR